MIGDGMQYADEIAASRYLHGTDRALSFHDFPYQALCTTWDVTSYDRYAFASGGERYSESVFDPELGYSVAKGGDRTYDGSWLPPSDEYFTSPLEKYGGGSKAVPATDSASAATAMSCGVKTEDGNIAWKTGDTEDGRIETIAELARRVRKAAIGVVTTVPFSHATPASFVSHNVDRDNYSSEKKLKKFDGECISEEIIRRSRPDVVIGAGNPVSGKKGYISEKDYEGLRSASQPPYDEWLFVERVPGASGEKAICEAAASAVAGNRKLFGLFGGPGNYMEHPVPSDTPGAPSFTWTTTENPTLAAASEAAITVLARRGGAGGFFLMIEGGDIDWANHAGDFAWMIGAVKRFDDAVRKVIEAVDRPGDGMDWGNTLLVVTADHANGYLRFAPGKVLGKGDLPEQTQAKPPKYPGAEVNYGVRNSHTNEPVMLYAKGACSDLFRQHEGSMHKGTRLIDNKHIYQVIRKAMGLD